MGNASYLESFPLFEIAKYAGAPPKDSTAFSGYPRKHPYDLDKLILVFDPLGKQPTLMEFKLTDVVYVEDLPSAVTESGEGVRLVKIWVRHGAYGIIHEPFEVRESPVFQHDSKALHDRILRSLR